MTEANVGTWWDIGRQQAVGCRAHPGEGEEVKTIGLMRDDGESYVDAYARFIIRIGGKCTCGRIQ